jgi:predicted metal-binding membrane protein
MTARMAVLPATLGLAAVAWVVTVHLMRGMDMGVGTELGSLSFFTAVWITMMAAMMLPGAVPALLESARDNGGAHAVLFGGSYLAVWLVVGLAVYGVYRPHGSAIAGGLTIAAGVYELTPLKRECRQRCQETVRSGLQFGLYCVGSGIGLMVVLVAMGVMNITWMALVAVVALAQKLVPPKASVDVALALAIVALGVIVVVAPSAVPLT